MPTRIVVHTNGETRVYTGWRAWLIGAAAFVISFAVLALVTFVLLGIAASVGALLLLLIPAALIMSGLAWLFAGSRT